MKKEILIISALIGCGGQGERGPKGDDGSIIFPPGSGTSIVADCDYQWNEADFRYHTFYKVWRKSDGKRRIAGVCNTHGLDDCEYHQYVTKEYPIDSAGYSDAKINDGLVEAKLSGPKEAIFTNRYGRQIMPDCKEQLMIRETAK